MMKFMVAGVVGLCFMLNFPFYVYAEHRVPTFTYNLGGMPISCSVYRNQISLNGIHAEDSLEKVRNILGIASFVSKKGGILEYDYKDNLQVYFADYEGNGSYVVFHIKAGRESTAATIDGVKVGMPETVLSQVYGTADNIDIRQSKAPKLSLEQNVRALPRCPARPVRPIRCT